MPWSDPAGQPAAHDDRVGSLTVITAPPADDLEAAPLVQTYRSGVLCPHLEGDLAATAPPRLVEEGVQQPAPESGPLLIGADTDGLYVGLVASGEQTRVTDDLPLKGFRHQVVPSVWDTGQLRPECLDGPAVVREKLALEFCQRRDVPPPHPAHDDGIDVPGPSVLLPRRAHHPVEPPRLSGRVGGRSPRDAAVTSLRAAGSTASGRRR